MDKDKVIELARKHGVVLQEQNCDPEYRFDADDLRAFLEAYRAEILAGSGEPVAWHFFYGNHGWPTFHSAEYVREYQPGQTLHGALYTADQLAAAVLRERDEATHWKNKCREIIRTYLVDDEAWDPEKETDEKLALHSRSEK